MRHVGLNCSSCMLMCLVPCDEAADPFQPPRVHLPFVKVLPYEHVIPDRHSGPVRREHVPPERGSA